MAMILIGVVVILVAAQLVLVLAGIVTGLASFAVSMVMFLGIDFVSIVGVMIVASKVRKVKEFYFGVE